MSEATRPPRGYSWPPFEPGNTVALRHGAWSPRKVEPLAAELVEAIAGTVDWWKPADMPSVWSWARTEARCQLLSEYLADHGGDLDDDGSVRAAADLLTRLEARAESLRSKLGLDPLSRSRMTRDTAAATVDLGKLMADGRAVIDARPVPLDDDEDADE